MTTCKVANARGDVVNIVKGLHRDNVGANKSIHCNVDQSLVSVSKRLKEAFNREARSLQQVVCDAVRVVVETT